MFPPKGRGLTCLPAGRGEGMRLDKSFVRNKIKARLIRRYRQGLLKNRSEAEKSFESLLKKLGIDFMCQGGIFNPKSFFIVDFYLNYPHKLIVEIDDESHLSPKRKRLDKARISYLKKSGFRILRFTNRTVLNDIEKVERQLIRRLEKAGKGFL